MIDAKTAYERTSKKSGIELEQRVINAKVENAVDQGEYSTLVGLKGYDPKKIEKIKIWLIGLGYKCEMKENEDEDNRATYLMEIRWN